MLRRKQSFACEYSLKNAWVIFVIYYVTKKTTVGLNVQ